MEDFKLYTMYIYDNRLNKQIHVKECAELDEAIRFSHSYLEGRVDMQIELYEDTANFRHKLFTLTR